MFLFSPHLITLMGAFVDSNIMLKTAYPCKICFVIFIVKALICRKCTCCRECSVVIMGLRFLHTCSQSSIVKNLRNVWLKLVNLDGVISKVLVTGNRNDGKQVVAFTFGKI